MSNRCRFAALAVLSLAPLAAQEAFRSYPDRVFPLPTGALPLEATLVDLRGEGVPDVVVGSLGAPNALFVFRNDGTGQFTEDVDARSNLTTSATRLLPGDFDGDGHSDLLITNSGALWRNDGRGGLTFAGRVFPPLIASDGRCAAADLDGDGDLDLALPRQGEPNVLLWNDGAGRFVDGSSRLTPDRQTTEVAVAADVDGDGDVDLLFGSWPSQRPGQSPHGRIKLHLNDGRGRFTDESAQRIGDVDVYALDVAATDLDGDGLVDLAVANALGPATLLVNDGQGHFQDRSADLPSIGQTSGPHFAALDFDHDGDIDLLLSSNAAQHLLVNDGNARFGLLPPSLLPDSVTGAKSALVGDLDLDGDLDLLLPRASAVGNNAAGLWFAQHRHLDASAPPRIGRPWTLEIGHRAGASPGFGAALPLLGQTLQRTPLGPLGLLGLAPDGVIALDPVALSGAADHTGWSIDVPDDPTLVGTHVAVQALILQPLAVARFTNVWRATLRPE